MARRRERERGASVRDVARHAGVSLSSVSRVLNDAPHVSPDLRARVSASVEALGYRPNQLARGLRSQVSRTVGFLVGDISNPLFSTIVSGAERVLRGAGYSVLLADSEGDPLLDQQNIELLVERRVDGLLTSLCSESYEPTYAALRGAGVPSVFIDREPRRRASSAVVLGDHAAAMTAATEYLLDLGHRRIGFVGGADVRPTRERVRALESTYAARGLEPVYRVRSEAFTESFGAEATRGLMSADDPCTALIFGGAHLLVGGLRVLRSLALDIPSDVSVVSCDDSAVSRVFDPELACIHRDLSAFGARAATMLLALMREEKTKRRVLVPSTFRAGASCAAPAGTSGRRGRSRGS